MADDKHDWGAIGLCWAAEASWRMAAVGNEGGLHYLAETQWQRQTAAGRERRCLMGDSGGQAAPAGGLGIDGVLEASRAGVQWDAGGLRGGVLAAGRGWLPVIWKGHVSFSPQGNCTGKRLSLKLGLVFSGRG
jgi:hypothetical protein